MLSFFSKVDISFQNKDSRNKRLVGSFPLSWKDGIIYKSCILPYSQGYALILYSIILTIKNLFKTNIDSAEYNA